MHFLPKNNDSLTPSCNLAPKSKVIRFLRTNLNYNTDINIVGSIPDYHLIYRALPLLYSDKEALYQMLVSDNEYDFRTERSRKRFLLVLSSAFQSDNNLINEFIAKLLTQPGVDDKAKRIILFWLFAMNNKLFYELNKDVFLNYYYQGRAELPSSDVEAYIDDLISRTPDLKDKWSKLTIRTIASKYLTVLKKMNLLEGTRKKTFCYVRVTDELLVCFIHIYSLLGQRGANFLEDEISKLMFVSQDSLLERLKKLGKKGWIKMNYTGTALRVESTFKTDEIVNGIFGRS